MTESNDALFLIMLTKFADCHIDHKALERARTSASPREADEIVEEAFRKFQALANCLNHIFEQFAVDAMVTRNGVIPRQEEKLVSLLYEPTLKALAHPKWKSLNKDLAGMFADYNERNYGETITKAHTAIHRFLQIVAGEEGKSGKGELENCFQRLNRKVKFRSIALLIP